jgi:hypothetical protein
MNCKSGLQMAGSIKHKNCMKTQNMQAKPESRKRNYTKPEIKKRERIKEITESPVPIPITITMLPG